MVTYKVEYEVWIHEVSMWEPDTEESGDADRDILSLLGDSDDDVTSIGGHCVEYEVNMLHEE